MKIKLSKIQWENIGKTAGWINDLTGIPSTYHGTNHPIKNRIFTDWRETDNQGNKSSFNECAGCGGDSTNIKFDNSKKQWRCIKCGIEQV